MDKYYVYLHTTIKNKIPYKAIWTACKNYEKGAKSKGFRWKFKKVLNM